MALPNYETTALVCTGIVSFYVLRSICSFLYTYLIGPAFNEVDFKSKGQWALVTGATDGIGKEYARELAHRGCDIILVSRTMEKLKAVANEIEQEYKVQTKVIQADFSKEEGIYEHIAKEISGLEIGTLVNNVGMYYRYPDKFCDILDFETFFRNLMHTNVTSVVRMTGLVLPQMVKRKKGVIVNVSSVAALLPCSMFTVYAASKAFVQKFTEGIQDEYRNSGVIIQDLLPGVVATNMTALKEGTLRKPDAKTYVQSAIKTVGVAAKTTGYLPHAIEIVAVNFMYFINRTILLKIIEKYARDQKEWFLKINK